MGSSVVVRHACAYMCVCVRVRVRVVMGGVTAIESKLFVCVRFIQHFFIIFFALCSICVDSKAMNLHVRWNSLSQALSSRDNGAADIASMDGWSLEFDRGHPAIVTVEFECVYDWCWIPHKGRFIECSQQAMATQPLLRFEKCRLVRVTMRSIDFTMLFTFARETDGSNNASDSNNWLRQWHTIAITMANWLHPLSSTRVVLILSGSRTATTTTATSNRFDAVVLENQ